MRDVQFVKSPHKNAAAYAKKSSIARDSINSFIGLQNINKPVKGEKMLF